MLSLTNVKARKLDAEMNVRCAYRMATMIQVRKRKPVREEIEGYGKAVPRPTRQSVEWQNDGADGMISASMIFSLVIFSYLFGAVQVGHLVLRGRKIEQQKRPFNSLGFFFLFLLLLLLFGDDGPLFLVRVAQPTALSSRFKFHLLLCLLLYTA